MFLQYLLGFRRLGWDVLFIDRSVGDDPAGVAYLARVMRRFGLEDDWAVVAADGAVVNLSRSEVERRLRGSAFLLNVMGYLDDEDLLAAAPRRVFLDIDPGFGQMWKALGLHDLFAGHDDHVTIGENVGRAGCRVPTGGLTWITTKQPVVLDEWPATPGRAGRFTTVASWRGPFGPIEYEGEAYGLRVHEFRRIVGLPARVDATFEVALDIHDADAADIRLLDDSGWTRVDPLAVAGDPDAYRAYVQGSGAELMVAKNLYVRAGSGWFSDRSICYLASGRPVLAQDTGLDGVVPSGDGLVLFSDLDGAVAGAEDVLARYDHHAKAARALAEDVFDSDVVLGRLLAELGVA